jgi:hypothetical protein
LPGHAAVSGGFRREDHPNPRHGVRKTTGAGGRKRGQRWGRERHLGHERGCGRRHGPEASLPSTARVRDLRTKRRGLEASFSIYIQFVNGINVGRGLSGGIRGWSWNGGRGVRGWRHGEA